MNWRKYSSIKAKVDSLPSVPRTIRGIIGTWIFLIFGIIFTAGAIFVLGSGEGDISMILMLLIGLYGLYTFFSYCKRKRLGKYSWLQYTESELELLNEHASAAQTMSNAFFTEDTVVLKTPYGTTELVPLKNVVWIFGNDQTNRYNGINAGKDYGITIACSDSRLCYIHLTHGNMNVANPINDAITTLKATFDKKYPGILYGYSDERKQYFRKNLRDMSLMVSADNKKILDERQAENSFNLSH